MGIAGGAARLLLAGMLLGGLLVAGCSDESGSPGDKDEPESGASKEDFCAAVDKLDAAENDFTAIRARFDELVEVGAPGDMPADAREGLEVMTELTENASSSEELSSASSKLPPEDQQKIREFFNYTVKTCLPSGTPTDSPSAPGSSPSPSPSPSPNVTPTPE